MALTPDEQLKKLDSEIKQLKSRKHAILNREKQKQNKEQIRRLIEYGTLVQKYLHYDWINSEMVEDLLKSVAVLPESEVKKLFADAKKMSQMLP